MEFKLNETELATLEGLKESILKLYDEVGPIIYSFTHTGIGVNVKVTFEKHNITKDITDYKSW